MCSKTQLFATAKLLLHVYVILVKIMYSEDYILCKFEVGMLPLFSIIIL